ncbi:MAG: hypothetical protein KGZ86_06710 [Candidatus Latescibacteria bacterium]|nr:hypothetical protein [Candidatus Latescibacterota bacterium]
MNKYIEQPNKIEIEIFRRMTGEDRLRIGFEMCEFVRKMIIAGIRNQYPNISEQELKSKVKERYKISTI